MLAALLLLNGNIAQNPTLPDSEATQIAFSFAKNFAFEQFNIVRVERPSKQNLNDARVYFTDKDGVEFSIWVNANSKKATGVRRSKLGYNGTGPRLGNPTDKEKEFAKQLVSSLHGNLDLKFSRADIFHNDLGEELLIVHGYFNHNEQSIYVGTKYFKNAEDEKTRARIEYGFMQAGGQFFRDTLRPAMLSLRTSGYTFDPTAPACDVTLLQAKSDSMEKSLLAAREKNSKHLRSIRRPTVSDPVIVQLVKPGESVVKLCYAIYVSRQINRGISSMPVFYTLFYDGKTGKEIKTGYID